MLLLASENHYRKCWSHKPEDFVRMSAKSSVKWLPISCELMIIGCSICMISSWMDSGSEVAVVTNLSFFFSKTHASNNANKICERRLQLEIKIYKKENISFLLFGYFYLLQWHEAILKIWKPSFTCIYTKQTTIMWGFIEIHQC